MFCCTIIFFSRILLYNYIIILITQRKCYLWNTINSQAMKQQPPYTYISTLFSPLTQTDPFSDSQTYHHSALGCENTCNMCIVCVWCVCVVCVCVCGVCVCVCVCVCVHTSVCFYVCVCQQHGIAQPRKEWQDSGLRDVLRVNKSC